MVKSALKTAAIKTICLTILKLAKKNIKSFAKLLKNKLIAAAAPFVVRILTVTGKSLALGIGLGVFSNVSVSAAKDRLFKNIKIYEWISALTSPGTIVAYVLDIISDGRPNKKIRITVG